MKIFAKTITGRTIELQVSPSDTIDSIKYQIQDKGGISVDRQRFVFCARELENTKTLEYYKIQEGYILHLVVKEKIFTD